MARKPSKKSSVKAAVGTLVDTTKKKRFSRIRNFCQMFRRKWQKLMQKIAKERAKHVHLHKSFKRSYREDYLRNFETPGLLSHTMTAMKLMFKNWRVFIPFLILMVAGYIIGVGLLSEDVYQQFNDSIDDTSAQLANGEIGNFARAGLLLISTITTGGLDNGMDETGMMFMVVLFLIMWLVTIFLIRRFLMGEKPKLRDGLYNALTPLLATFVVFAVIFIQAVPLLLVVITYNAAVVTDFLATPFYALVYFIFAALMILLSSYLLSSSVIALVAVTAPGLYPLKALLAASDLMAGRRTRFILRLVWLIIIDALIYTIIMMPVILLDLVAKGAWEWLNGIPIVPFFLLLATCFVFVYSTVYIYQYYRWLLDYKEK